MDKRNRREEIMQATEGLFTSRRFHEIRLDDVAREAGVGKGTIYRHFRDKDDLFFQTATNGFDKLCHLLKRAAPGGAPFARELLSACTQISAFFRKRKSLFRMMQSEGSRIHWCKAELRRRWMVRRERLASAVADILRRGMEEGRVRRDVPAEVLASVLLGMLRTHARDLAETLGDGRSLGTVVELFLNGAGADACQRRASRRPLSAETARSGDRI